MPFRCRPALLFLALIIVAILVPGGSIAAERSTTQYLLFHIFTGNPDPRSGIYRRARSKEDLLGIVRKIARTVPPARIHPDRILGFAVGPIAMDQGEEDARSIIRDAFDIALETDMAVTLHLDDYMFWSQARWPNGRLLSAAPGAAEWRDWSQGPPGGLSIGWLPNVKLMPQLCYESPEVQQFTTYWTRDVIGREIKNQFDRLVRAGKARLFAGVIVGWESNLANGYCSLSHLGYSAQRLPADFDRERERVLQRHIERWSKGIFDSGIPRQLIFTHIAPIPKRDYDKMSAMLPRSRIREMPQSTAFRAFWTAFNSYSTPGFSAYPDEGRFEDIYQAVQAYDRQSWAMAEGTNLVLGGPQPGGAARSPLDWETYLGRSFNHGATMVNIFGGFQDEGYGAFHRAAESEEALAAYHKFLQGDKLIEDGKR
jgi:hypothetical protein